MLSNGSFRQLERNPEFERLRSLPEPDKPADMERDHPDPITISGIDWDTAVLKASGNKLLTDARDR
jgi:hypothetical protein